MDEGANQGVALLCQWIGLHWPWLLVPGLLGLAILLVNRWDWLLEQPWGSWWPVPAAILPACIPLARSLEGKAPGFVQASTVTVLLLAVAVLQLYGQERNKRDRIETENRINEQTDRINEQTALLASLLDESRKGRNEVAEQTALLCRIVDGIAAEEEEEER